MDICSTGEDHTELDCSHLFEGIHPAFTIIQACTAAIFVVTAVPLNLMLTVAIIRFRRQMDEGFILCINIFIANMIMSFSVGINLFMSSATRSWPLGYAGCQVFAFFSFYPTMVRWVALGTVSIDRFCRVFLPYLYDRHSKVVITILFIVPWIAVLPFNILSLARVSSKYEMSILFPACHYQFHCNGSITCMVLTHANIVLVLASGSVLPIAIYTVLYIKSRRMFRATQVLYASNEQLNIENERQKMATKTFALMVVIFSCYSAAGIFLMSFQAIPMIQIMKGSQFFLFDLILTYNIADFLVVWKNKDGKQAIKKLINTIARKQVCHSDAVVPLPMPAANQEPPPAVPVTGSGQQQVDNDPPAPVPASGQTQPDRSIPAPTTVADQEQLSTSLPPPPICAWD